MPGAESVTMLSREWVVTRPVPGNSSMARKPLGCPAVTPYFTRRAAVRWATPMPSPSMITTFLTSPLSPKPPPTRTIWIVDDVVCVPVASVKLALRTCEPGEVRENPRRLNPPYPALVIPSVVLVFCAPEVKVKGTPSRARVAEKGPAPLPSTRRSKR